MCAARLRTPYRPASAGDQADVCWQLPIRRAYRDAERPDGTSYLEITIGSTTAGPGGRADDLDWYCSGSAEAHVGAEPVYVSCEPELQALMGDAAYAELARHCAAHLAAQLPLLIHPATADARRRAAATRLHRHDPPQ